MTNSWGPLDGKEFERLSQTWTPHAFETFCQSLIVSEMPRDCVTLPTMSGRPNCADGGLDAECLYDGEQPLGKLVSPGLNLYEVKWRDPYQRDKGLKELKRLLSGKAIQSLQGRGAGAVHLRVFLNLNLTHSQRASLLKSILNDCPLERVVVEVIDAGLLAVLLNQHVVLRAMYRPASGLIDFQAWRSSMARGTHCPSLQFVGRDCQLEALQQFFVDPTLRVVHLFGAPGIGKTRTVLQALEGASKWVVERTAFVEDPTRLGPGEWQQLREAAHPFWLVAENVDEERASELAQRVAETRFGQLVITSRSSFFLPSLLSFATARVELHPLGYEATQRLALQLQRHKPLPYEAQDWLIEKTSGNVSYLLLGWFSGLESGLASGLGSIIEEIGPRLAEQIRKNPGPEALRMAQLISLFPQGLSLGTKLGPILGFEMSDAQKKSSLKGLTQDGWITRTGGRPESWRYHLEPSLLSDHLAVEYWMNARRPLNRILSELSTADCAPLLERLLEVLTPESRDLAKGMVSGLEPEQCLSFLAVQTQLALRALEQAPEAFDRHLCVLPPEQVGKLHAHILQKLLRYSPTASTSLRALRCLANVELARSSKVDLYYSLFCPDSPGIALNLQERLQELRWIVQESSWSAKKRWGVFSGAIGNSRLLVPWSSSELPPTPVVSTQAERDHYLDQVVEYALEIGSQVRSEDLAAACDFAGQLLARNRLQKCHQLLTMLVEVPPKGSGDAFLGVLRQIRRSQPDDLAFESLDQQRRNAFPLLEVVCRAEPWLWGHHPEAADDLSGRLLALENAGARLIQKKYSSMNWAPVDSRSYSPVVQEFMQLLGAQDLEVSRFVEIPAVLRGFYLRGALDAGQIDQDRLRQLVEPLELTQRLRIASDLGPDRWRLPQMLELLSDVSLTVDFIDGSSLPTWCAEESPSRLAVLRCLSEKHYEASRVMLLLCYDAIQATSHFEPKDDLAVLSLSVLSLRLRMLAQEEQAPLSLLLATRLLEKLPGATLECFEQFLSSCLDEAPTRAYGLGQVVSLPVFDLMRRERPDALLRCLLRLLGEAEENLGLSLRLNLQGVFSVAVLRSVWQELGQPDAVSSRIICLLLDMNDPDFWPFVDEILHRFDYSSRYQEVLYVALTNPGRGWWGPESEMLQKLREVVEGAVRDHGLSSKTRAWVEDCCRRVQDREFAAYVWEYNMSSDEFESMLTSPDPNLRRWAMSRMIRELTPREWLQRISPEAIRADLSELRIDDKKKRILSSMLEAWQG